MANLEDNTAEKIQQAIDHAVQTAKKLYGENFNARLELCKNIVTLAAAVLGLSISFIADDFSSKSLGFSAYILALSWAALAISILVAVIAMINLYSLSYMATHLYSKSEEIEEKIFSIPLSERYGKEISIIEEATVGVVESFKPSDAISEFCVKLQILLFALGMAAFCIFGISLAV